MASTANVLFVKKIVFLSAKCDGCFFHVQDEPVFLVLICTYNIVIVLFIFHRVLETVCLIFALEVCFTVTLFYLN